MAVDTSPKRHSALHYFEPGIPLPDGTIGTPDRITLIGLYGDLSAAPLVLEDRRCDVEPATVRGGCLVGVASTRSCAVVAASDRRDCS